MSARETVSRRVGRWTALVVVTALLAPAAAAGGEGGVVVEDVWSPADLDSFASGVVDAECWVEPRPLTAAELDRLFAGLSDPPVDVGSIGGAVQCATACGCTGCYWISTGNGYIPVCATCGACCPKGFTASCSCHVSVLPLFVDMDCGCKPSGGAPGDEVPVDLPVAPHHELPTPQTPEVGSLA